MRFLLAVFILTPVLAWGNPKDLLYDRLANTLTIEESMEIQTEIREYNYKILSTEVYSLFEQGYFFMRAANLDIAEKKFLAISELDDQATIHLHAISGIYYVKWHYSADEEYIKTAFFYIEKCLNRDPRQIDCLYTQGFLYFMIRDFEKGLDAWDRLLDLAPFFNQRGRHLIKMLEDLYKADLIYRAEKIRAAI